jgi:O-antigen/teichoic acid export membrane protein
MENASQLRSEETLRQSPPASKTIPRAQGWLPALLNSIPTATRLRPFAYSFTDQALAVGGVFLVNIVLARTQTKEEYGMFVLSYSVFTFLYGLYNAAIVEPYTVYGSGRYHEHYSEYLRFMVRNNAVIGFLLTGVLLLAYSLFLWVAPHQASMALVGLALTAGVLLSATFLRRAFYVERHAVLAARTSLLFFVAVSCGLWLAAKVRVLDSFSVFLILALAWIAAGVVFGKELTFGKPTQYFLELQPGYWREHWNYTRWSLVTAFAYQLTTLGYYWLVAAFLSVKQVAELRATYLLVSPVEQVFIAISFIVLPALASHYAAKSMENLLFLWARNALAVTCVTGLFAVAVWTLGKEAMHFFYAGRFDGLTPLLYMLALLPILTGIGGTMINALNAIEKPKLVLYAYMCSCAVTFLAGIPLVVHSGLRGAAYGMLLSGAAYTGALAIAFLFNVYKPALRAIRSGARNSAGIER